MPLAARTGLYDPASSPPQLTGTRCRTCGATFFPPLAWGCEVCGALPDLLASVPLEAAGSLYSFATVHRHFGKDIEAPFTMGEVLLDAGPLIRVTMRAATDDGLRIGMRVSASWVVVSVDDEGNEIVEPRFFPVAGAAGDEA